MLRAVEKGLRDLDCALAPVAARCLRYDLLRAGLPRLPNRADAHDKKVRPLQQSGVDVATLADRLVRGLTIPQLRGRNQTVYGHLHRSSALPISNRIGACYGTGNIQRSNKIFLIPPVRYVTTVSGKSLTELGETTKPELVHRHRPVSDKLQEDAEELKLSAPVPGNWVYSFK